MITHSADVESDRPNTARRRMSAVAADLAKLVELNAALFRADLQAAQRKAVTPIVLCGLAIVFLISGMTVLLIALGVALGGIDPHLASMLALAGVVGLVLCGVCVAVATKIGRSLAGPWRSVEELKTNLSVLRATIFH